MLAERIKTFKRAAEVSLEAARKWCREAAGRTLNVLLAAADGDIGEVIMAVRRTGLPRRLQGWFNEDGTPFVPQGV
jgi:DNA relaxase NicK